METINNVDASQLGHFGIEDTTHVLMKAQIFWHILEEEVLNSLLYFILRLGTLQLLVRPMHRLGILDALCGFHSSHFGDLVKIGILRTPKILLFFIPLHFFHMQSDKRKQLLMILLEQGTLNHLP